MKGEVHELFQQESRECNEQQGMSIKGYLCLSFFFLNEHELRPKLQNVR